MAKDNFLYIPKRKKNSHKGDYGHLFVIAGSLSYYGAAYLASQAAIRSGCGMVTLGFPKSLKVAMDKKLIEVIKKPFPETSDCSISLKAYEEIIKLSDKADAICIGPGLSRNENTVKLVNKLLPEFNKPFILDADGLNAVTGDTKVLKKIKVDYIITPHSGEMERLIGKSVSFVQKNRIPLALNFAKVYNAVVILKGFRTVVANPKGDYYINKTGNPGMATAGMGDVLSGMVGSFLAQGMDVYKSARLGAYLHGLAGDIAVKEVTESSLIASDILEKIPEAFKKAVHRT